MAQRITIPFVGPTSTARAVTVNNQSTVNMMQAAKTPGAKSAYVLENIPGTIDRGVMGNGPIRTAKLLSSKISGTEELYGVFGTKLMAQTLTAPVREIGTLGASSDRVTMARGRNYIAMVDGVDGYTYDGTTFAVISDADFPKNSGGGRPTHIDYIDGYFICNDANTDNWYISAPEDPTSWNALDFEAASVSPDAALALSAIDSMVWVIGDETAQAYYNSGNRDFPYEVILSATQKVGILAPYTLAATSEGLFFLATTPEGGRFVYRIKGQSGEVISADEQEATLENVTDPAQAYAFVYKQSGKSFYVLQLPATGGPDPRASSTLVYNLSVGMWESRELNDGSAWRVGGIGQLGARNIGGSRIQARGLELSLTTYTDIGQEIIRRRRTQIFHNNNLTIEYQAIIIDVQTGNIDRLDYDPKIKLRYSNDSGINWSDWLIKSLGRIGETSHRVVFRRLGQGRNRVWEIECSEPLPLTIQAAYAEVNLLGD